MYSLKLRPWPFKKDEEVELYWLCSPYLSYNKGWIIRAFFKKNNIIKMVELPWGTLPYLRLGKKYIDGKALEVKSKGFIGDLRINDEEFEICSSFDMPSKLYYLYKNYLCGIEKLCKVRVRNNDYYIPCVEIVRSFLAKSKTLTNYLLKPNGLDFLIDKAEIIDNSINLFLTNEVPRKIVLDDNVIHLVWLRYNSDAFNAWSSVYNNIFSKAVEASTRFPLKELKSGVLIELKPPIRKQCRWTYRGIKSGNSILILELITTTGVIIPFENIYYFHPSFDKVKVIGNSGRIRKSNNSKEEYQLPDRNLEMETKKNSNQPAIELMSTNFVYHENLNIKRLSGVERESENGIKVINTKEGSDKKVDDKDIETASTQDWSSTGKIEPIEFKSLEIVKGEAGRGLQYFYKTMEYIKRYYTKINLYVREIFLPRGKTFSNYPNGERRNCAIVRIDLKSSLTCYIIEVGRADNWSISTLIIYPTLISSMNNNVENLIEKLLKSIVDNKGHWDNKLLSNNKKIKFYNIKHINDENIYNYANRILGKIMKIKNSL